MTTEQKNKLKLEPPVRKVNVVTECNHSTQNHPTQVC